MTQIKICGLTTLGDVQAAVDCGVEFLGFIFYDKSPRHLSLAQAAEIMTFLRGYETPIWPQCVAVFVNPDPAYVEDVLSETGFQAAQIHRAGPDRLRELRVLLNSVMYASLQPRVADEIAPVLVLDDDPELAPTAFWLPQLHIDAYHPDLAGGTGQVGDWTVAAQVASHVPRLMLAGGLTPDNVADAIRAVRPWAVDVSSGVERLPGLKNHDKIRAFVNAVREVDERLHP